MAEWSKGETKSSMRQVFVRAHRATKDAKVVWKHSLRDPRYRFTNQTIVEMLGITAEEEQEMETIILEHTRLSRDKQRKEIRRRKQGAKPRKEYMAEVSSRRAKAKKLREQGYTLAEIARLIGRSQRQVSRLLSSGE